MTAGWMIPALAAAMLIAGHQAEPDARLIFREDWTEAPAALPVTQAHVANADLVLALHGPGGERVKKSHHDQPADDPYYVWSGEAEGTWAVSLSRRDAAMDLGGGGARVRWRARQSGFRRLHVMLQLDEHTWIVSDQADGESDVWHVSEFRLRELRWRELAIDRIVEGDPVPAPDLTRVLAVGVTDLMRGGGTPASSRLDWIEVYGRTRTSGE